jgi:hypothetical protein
MRTALALLLTAPLLVQTTLAQSWEQEFFDTLGLNCLKLTYRSAGRDSGLAEVAATAARRGYWPDIRNAFAPLFAQTTLAQSSERDLFEILGLDHLKLIYRYAGHDSGLADVAGTAKRQGFLPDMRSALAPLFVQTTLAQSSEQDLFEILGLDHFKLTYRYAGRDFRLSDVARTVAPGIFA